MDLRKRGVVDLLFSRARTVGCDACEVSITFHTPCGTTSLDEKTLSTLDAGRLKRAARELNGRSVDASWTHLEGARLQLQNYGLSLRQALEQQMPRPILRAERRSPSETGIAHACARVEWTPRSTEVTVWNVGCALLTVEYTVRIPTGHTWRDFRAAVSECRVELSRRGDGWVGAVLEDFSAYAQEQQWLEDTALRRPTESFWSQPLWTYEWFSVLAPRRTSKRAVGGVARALVKEGETCPGAASAEDSEIRIALQACCVTRQSGCDAADRADAQRLKEHVEAHTVCWGAAVTLDRFVWERLAALQFADEDSDRLDTAADQLLKLADKVSFFLMTIGGVSPHLDPSDAALWRCLDDGWRFPEVRQSLAERLAAVRELQTEKAARLSNKRLRRLNAFLLGLTIIGVFASVVSVVDVARGWNVRSAQVDQVEPGPEATRFPPSPGR